ncbi:MAG: MFS transporter [Thermoleophilia bacterium]|nr:MFS transporter [Thermoleophilia bacterium]
MGDGTGQPAGAHGGVRATRLPLRAKALFACSSFGGEALTQSRSLWLLFFYTEATDVLSPLAVGAIITVARLVETVDDGLIGYWSDRTHSRFGRRFPFILAATPFVALFSVLLFTPPTSSAAAAGAYLFIMLELYFVSSTISGGPYEALLPEIAKTSDDRVSITGMKVYFGAAGAGFGLVASGLLKDAFGFAAMAAVFAIVLLTLRYAGVAGVWSHASRTVPPADIPLVTALRTTFSNRAFIAFLPTFALFQLAFQMLTGLLPFYAKAVLGVVDAPDTFHEIPGALSEKWVGDGQPGLSVGQWVSILTASAFVAAAAMIPLAQRYGRRTSKRRAYRVSMLTAAVAFPLVAVAGLLPWIPGWLQILVAMMLVGLPISGNYLFPAPLTADIVDDDSLNTGMRREATYFGAQNFVEKTTSAFTPLLLALLLSLGSTSQDQTGIRLVGPVAGVLVLVAWLSFRRYDLPDDVLAERGRQAGDPPSSATDRPAGEHGPH